jgi:hypothetical protein
MVLATRPRPKLPIAKPGRFLQADSWNYSGQDGLRHFSLLTIGGQPSFVVEREEPADRAVVTGIAVVRNRSKIVLFKDYCRN